MKSALRLLGIAFLAIFLQACALAPLATELPLIAGTIQSPPKKAGETYVLLYNNASQLLHGVDNSSSLNVQINGKGVGGLDIGQFVQIVLPNGDHTLTLIHRDVVVFKSDHPIRLNGEPVYIEMWPTIVSNAVRVHTQLPTGNELPRNFLPYRP